MPHQLLTMAPPFILPGVTTRPKILRNSNCTRDRTTLDRQDLSKPAMGAGECPGERLQREKEAARETAACPELRQGINESERQIRSLLRRFAWKVDRRAAKIEPQTRPGNPRARWGAYRLLARTQNPASSEGGTMVLLGLRALRARRICNL